MSGGRLARLLRARRTARVRPAPRVVAGTVRTVEAYGPGPLQRGEWWVPPAPEHGEGPLPTVVLVHGGYWRPRWDRGLGDAVAADLAGRGVLVWNPDYAAGDAPWPQTLLDVAAAHDHLLRSAIAPRVDTARTALVGHSAGGQLALWLAARPALPPTAPGAGPLAPPPVLVVAQAPVAALADAAREGLGGGAAVALVGGTPEQVPDRYRVADPVALVPAAVPTLLLHSADDSAVPLRQSRTYAQAAGPRARLLEVPGDHFAHLDPSSRALDALRGALLGALHG